MSTRKQHLVAFAALLSPALLFATSINVTFDAALTNATGWSFNDKVGNNNNGYYLLQAAEVTTPQFGFNITSVEIRVSTTASCNRNLIIRPGDNASSDPDYAFNAIPTGATTNLVATWNTASPIRFFTINSTEGSKGNLYIKSAVISGVPLIEPPMNLQTNEIKGTRCRLSWANPVNAVSNKIEVSEVVRKVVYGTMLDEYDFMAFTNKSSVTEHYDKQSLQVNDYPSFSGTNIYKAASNSTGVVQISNGKSQGYLKYDFSAIRDSLDEAADISLHISAKKHNTDISTINWKLLVAQIDDNNTTNKTDEIDIEGDFPAHPSSIQIEQARTCKAIVLRPSDETPTARRILIDYFAIVNNFSPASVSTNLVKTIFTTDNAATIRGLSPNSSYIASVTAFNADGNESAPSEPIPFMTNGAELPLVIKLQ